MNDDLISRLHPTLWSYKDRFNEEELEELNRLAIKGRIVRYKDFYRKLWRIPEEEIKEE